MIDKALVRHGRSRWGAVMAGAGLVVALGCKGSGGHGLPTMTGAGGGGMAEGRDGGGGGASGGAAGTTCSGSDVIAPKRMVRLSFNQIANAIRSLLGGGAITDQIVIVAAIPDPQHRTFPPLANPREGSVISDNNWSTSDQIAQQAAAWVSTNFVIATGCAAATDDCAQAYLADLVTRAFRRPATGDETAALMQVYKDVENLGGTVEEATQYGVYAILSAPQFLYRTEFGASALDAGALTPYELASAISFFLTDAPPDAQLLAAAAGDGLGNPDQVRAQVARLLATPEARANLEAAMFSYFAIPSLENIIIDTSLFPAWNDGLRNSMRHESELFLHDTLWNGSLAGLLTSQTSRINGPLADLYGVAPFPQPGATVASDGFSLTQLPATRSGILTQAGFLVARARPNGGSVVGRGLLVNAEILCGTNPAFPTDLEVIDAAEITRMLAGATEREKAAYRADPSRSCSACHPSFDPFGLALENYDGLGRYRTVDDQGRPIDAAVTLPAAAGGQSVANAVEMSAVLASESAFPTCMARNLMVYALAEAVAGTSIDSCATQQIASAVAAGDGTFTSLVTEIAASQTLSVRAAGGAQ